MQEGFPESVLFPVLRAGLSLNEDIPALTDSDVSELLQIGKRQSILPVMLYALQRCKADTALTERFQQACEKDVLRFLFMEQAVQQICAALDDASVPYILLKGATIRALYPEPWLRTSSDIDVLVHEDDLEHAIAALEYATDFISGKRSDHDVCMMNAQVHLELHFCLDSGEDGAQGALLTSVWSHTHREGESFCCSMEPAFQTFYHLCHMSRHLRRQGMGIRPVMDLFLLRQNLGREEKPLRELCAQCGLLRFYDATSLLSDVWFGTAQHTPLTQALEAFCLSGGVFGSEESGVIARRREDSSGLSYLLHRIFLPRKRLEAYYPALKDKPNRLAYYQIKRWFRATTKEHERIQKELKILTEERASAEKFEKLMRSLEL